jgi:hypothetical protein
MKLSYKYRPIFTAGVEAPVEAPAEYDPAGHGVQTAAPAGVTPHGTVHAIEILRPALAHPCTIVFGV